ncbi:hypothetical protein GCM10023185_35710 [Hymenobacter saemangeumensis]|uniref:Uncharacterized protein n=1 Tax=Hymenobacter saemangeumensis TaxID=1084522 RepID=A0ABP8IPP8_9BACT
MPNSLDGSSDKVHNGFFGYSYQRLEMVFTSVQRDAKSPNIYHVQGKNRRYKIVRAFSGTITLNEVHPYDKSKPSYGAEKGEQAYTATGKFVLREEARRGDDAYGTFSGDLAVDFSRRTKGGLQLNTYTANNQTRNGGFLMDGMWKDAATGAEVDVLIKNGMAVTRQVIHDFKVGDRMMHTSRKYTRVGWDTYWGNEEWWAEKPMARK